MNDSFENELNPEKSGPSQGFKQLLALVLLAGAIVILGAVFVIQRELANQRDAMQWTLGEFGLAAPTMNRMSPDYTDADGNLIADAPTDEADIVRPGTLTFSFIAGTELADDTEFWKPLTDAISDATGLDVEVRSFDTFKQQLLEMRTTGLHVVALNTGAVPMAVNTCGFVPVSTFGDADGQFGVTSKMIVPKDSTASGIAGLKDKRIMFTSPTSNSGFKAPIVILNEDFGMKPSIDYDYGFSTSHQSSIDMIRTKAVVAAPIASDMLDRAVADGQISADDFRVVYESERFPPAAFGYISCIEPELAEKISSVLTDFELAGTPMEDEFRAQRLVPVDYKNDWALIRRIDNALGVVHSLDQDEPTVVAEIDSEEEPAVEVALQEDNEVDTEGTLTSDMPADSSSATDPAESPTSESDEPAAEPAEAP